MVPGIIKFYDELHLDLNKALDNDDNCFVTLWQDSLYSVSKLIKLSVFA